MTVTNKESLPPGFWIGLVMVAFLLYFVNGCWGGMNET